MGSLGKLRVPATVRAPQGGSALGSSRARTGRQSRFCPGAGRRLAVTAENPQRELLPSKSSLPRKELRELKSTRRTRRPLFQTAREIYAETLGTLQRTPGLPLPWDELPKGVETIRATGI